MIKICGCSIVPPLRMIFIDKGVFPSKWNKSNVCPIHKKESKRLLKNYRPISLLPVVDKIFEKIIYNSLYEYLLANTSFTPFQSDFRNGDSCVSQLLAVVHNTYKHLDSNASLDTRAVILDVAKAFDNVWHERLLFMIDINDLQDNIKSNLISLRMMIPYLRL